MSQAEPERLLGYLVDKRRHLMAEGEVLATLGLSAVLRDPTAKAAFQSKVIGYTADLIGSRRKQLRAGAGLTS
jgi:hypothetical protein